MPIANRIARLLPRPFAAGRLAPWALPGLVLAILAVAYGRTLAPGVTWANAGVDGGDLVTAAAVGGVAHPTGYPTYLLLARLFQALPAGDLAYRVNLMSAVAAGLAALVVYAIVRAWLGERGALSATAPALAALAFGLSPVFWSQAVVAEVYTLAALFAALILWFTLRVLQTPSRLERPWPGRLEALLAGLALGTHVTVAIPAAGYLAAVAWVSPGRLRWARLAERLGWIGLGLLVYLILPIRALAHPPVNWGDASTWEGFWWLISGRPYRELAFGLPASFLGGRVEAWAGYLVRQFGVLGLGLGLFGLFYGDAHARPFVWITAGVGALESVFAVAYGTRDSYTYLIPFYLVFATWIGLGAATLLERIGRWRAAFTAPVAALLFLGLLIPAIPTAREVDASRDRRAIEFAAAVLGRAPFGALLLTSEDRDTFALWYYHHALGERPDVSVVVEPLLYFDWYRENLRAVYPDLALPDASNGSWGQALASANPSLAALCRTRLAGASVLDCEPP